MPSKQMYVLLNKRSKASETVKEAKKCRRESVNSVLSPPVSPPRTRPRHGTSISKARQQAKTFPPNLSTLFWDVKLPTSALVSQSHQLPGNQGPGLILDLTKHAMVKDKIIKKNDYLPCLHSCSPACQCNLYVVKGASWERHLDTVSSRFHQFCTPECTGWFYLSLGAFLPSLLY